MTWPMVVLKFHDRPVKRLQCQGIGANAPGLAHTCANGRGEPAPTFWAFAYDIPTMMARQYMRELFHCIDRHDYEGSHTNPGMLGVQFW
jgi:hypothetical protein